MMAYRLLDAWNKFVWNCDQNATICSKEKVFAMSSARWCHFVSASNCVKWMYGDWILTNIELRFVIWHTDESWLNFPLIEYKTIMTHRPPKINSGMYKSTWAQLETFSANNKRYDSAYNTVMTKFSMKCLLSLCGTFCQRQYHDKH